MHQSYQKLYFEFKAEFQEVYSDLRQKIRINCDTVSMYFSKGGLPFLGGR